MDELKDIKLKNYQYLNEVAIKEKRSSRAPLYGAFPICEIARSRSIDDIIYNRGISGLNTDEFLQHIHPLLLDLQPSKVFINIGTNDMTEEPYGNQWFQHLTANISQILEQTQAILPNTKIYLMAFYPANLHLPWQTPAYPVDELRTPENLDRCNQALEEIAKTYGCHFINCNADLVNDRKEQKAEHTYDGVHLYANAYLKVFEVLSHISCIKKI
ncbi:MAG: GDSL-type esterase/lipase family protein [Streptococcus sp.]